MLSKYRLKRNRHRSVQKENPAPDKDRDKGKDINTEKRIIPAIEEEITIVLIHQIDHGHGHSHNHGQIRIKNME